MTQLLDNLRRAAKPKGFSLSISKRRLYLACFFIFLIAAGVRILVWQNNRSDIERSLSGVSQAYLTDARTLLAGDLNKFVFGINPPSDANVLAHPPGYPIIMAAVYGVFGEGNAMTIAQIVLNSFAPVLVFLIALQLFSFRVGLVAGFLIAVSPQLSYNSAILLPDSLSVIPILLSVYFLIRAYNGRSLKYEILCGLSLGAACWLRPNPLFLPIFVVLFAVFAVPKDRRLRFPLVVTIVFMAVIAPITIRNYVGFGYLIPLSLGSGVTFVEGIADFDKESRFGLAATDEGVMELEAKTFDRPDYYGSLYNPDGIERENGRLKMGLAVVRSDPLWFARVASRRGVSMFRFERVPAITDNPVSSESVNRVAYYLNLPLRLFQRLFISAIFLPLFVIGIVLLLKDKTHWRKSLILLTVPLYFVCFQSLLHTEYRYVLAVPHFVLIFAAVAIDNILILLESLLKIHRPADTQ